MSALTRDQLELLQRARDGKDLWGGHVRLVNLQGELELLLSLGLVEPDGEHQYLLTGLGVRILDAAER